MGLFYANLTVYRPRRAALVAALRMLRRTAFVSPTVEGHTVICDRTIDDQNSLAIEQLGCRLTKDLACVGLAAVLHDDDVLYLWLFQNGELRDHYDSLPGYFDPEAEPGGPAGGDSRLLCEAFARPHSRGKVQAILRANLLEGEWPAFPGEEERHEALAAALGMPRFAVGLGYAAIAGNLVPKEFHEVKFEAIGQG
jgi:hypothetical protein